MPNIKIIVKNEQKYLSKLSNYSSKILKILIKIAKNLLTLNINNTILLSLFEVLVELMRVSSAS
jgi:hypothetical protein